MSKNSPSQGFLRKNSPFQGSPNNHPPARNIGPSIRILQLNIEGSSRPKCDYLASLAHKHSVDIICLQEHHISKETDLEHRGHIPGFQLKGFTLSHTYGSALYQKSSNNDCSVTSVSDLNNFELLTAKIGNVNLMSVYKPPAMNLPSTVLPDLAHPALYIGDFNSHHTSWGYLQNDKNGEGLHTWAESNNKHLVYDPKGRSSFKSARWRSETNPDLCFVSEDHQGHALPATRRILDNFPHSQHRPSLITIGIQVPLIRSISRPRWNFSKADWVSYAQRLDATLRFIPPEAANYNRFVKATIAAAKHTIPRGFRKEYVPGWSSDTQKAYQEFLLNEDPETAAELLASLDASRRAKWESCVESMDFTHSSKRSWAVLRKLGGAPQHEQKTPAIHPKEIARRLKSLTTAGKIDKVSSKQARAHLDGFLKNSEDMPSFSAPFTLLELNDALATSKLNKAGPGGMYPEFGKKGKEWIVKFFNNIQESCSLPDALKRSKVIAILKPGKSPEEAASYRPISLLSTIYKLLERLLYSRIYPAVDQCIPPEQAGFRSGRNCTDQVLALSSYIEAGFQIGLKTFVAFVDLSSAYDTVWITGMLNKVAEIIPCRKTIALLKTLLGPRYVKVCLGEKQSNFVLLKNGLPQGSVLAPLLFNIYIRDMPSTDSLKFAYADDLAIAYQSKSFEEGGKILTKDLSTMGDFYTKWRLCPNPSKTEVSAFHLSNCLAQSRLQVKFCGKLVRHNFTPKYLGVILDRSLTYKQHLEATAQKIKTRLNIIKRLAGTSWGADAAVLRTSALALVYSTAEYCAPVWYRSAHTRRVDTQLHEAMRIITGLIQSTPLPWLPVLSHIPPPSLRRNSAASQEWRKCWQFRNGKPMPIRRTLDTLPPQRLPSRSPIWSDIKINTISEYNIDREWRLSWEAFQHPSKWLMTEPTLKPAGFSSPRALWVKLNRFRTGHGRFNHFLHKWGLKDSPHCDCGAVDQTAIHVVEECPLHRFPGGLKGLHEFTPAAIDWIRQLNIPV